MKEYMFFIRKNANSSETLSAEKHREFLKSCESYIAKLKLEGRLVSAQPIVWEGNIIGKKGGDWKSVSYNDTGEVLGGYYHIRAKDLEEAIEIAKGNPEFAFNEGTRIEVRPLKTKEQETGFEYPTK